MKEKRDFASGGPTDQPTRDPCPRCGSIDAVMSLLTSSNKYLACLHCRHRWHLAVQVK